MIAELVALRAEMTGDDAEPEPETCGEPVPADADGSAYYPCTRPPHGPEYDHEVFTSDHQRLTYPAATEAAGAETASECGASPYPAGSEGDDGTRCGLPAGHAGEHDDTPAGSGAPDWCPASTVYDEGGDHLPLYCDRLRGHQGSHHAPGPDEGSEVAWSDEPASVTA